MRTATIKRTYTPTVTLGELTMQDGDSVELLKTIELPWKDNRATLSCIPEGTYEVYWAYSPSKKIFTYRVLNVKGRDGVLFHVANYTRQLKGCIAPCLSHADIDKDGTIDGVSSGAALAKFEKFFKKERFELIIQKA